MKLLSLDVAGVLNSPTYYRRRGHRMSWPHLDPTAGALLGELVRRSGGSVVVSSTYRSMGRPWLREQLRAVGYTGRLLGVTPMLRGRTRGDEIRAWLDAYRHPSSAHRLSTARFFA